MKSKWIVALIMVAIGGGAAGADDTYWQHDPLTPGDWHDDANWTDGAPSGGVRTYIDNDGTALISTAGSTARAGNTYIGYNASGAVVHDEGAASLGHTFFGQKVATASGSYELSGGELVAVGLYLGGRGTGQFIHSGGTGDIVFVYLGWNEGQIQPLTASYGSYALSGSAQLTADDLSVGLFGEGLFTQTGNTSVTAVGLRVGPHGVGRYELSGGTILADTLNVGANGTFVQTSGDVTASDRLDVHGEYSLSGAANVSTDIETLTGLFRQEGGLHSVDDLWLRNGSRYEMTGGTLAIGTSGVGQSELDFDGQAATVTLADRAFLDLS
ncbi:hypothetical protein LCGC14_1880900, partial [marine sediment metagenome]